LQEVRKKLARSSQEVRKKFARSLQEVCKKFARSSQEVRKKFARSSQAALRISTGRPDMKFLCMFNPTVNLLNWEGNYGEECSLSDFGLSLLGLASTVAFSFFSPCYFG
jgi:hypothetical protein